MAITVASVLLAAAVTVLVVKHWPHRPAPVDYAAVFDARARVAAREREYARAAAWRLLARMHREREEAGRG